MIRFIHAADSHIDSPLKGLDAHEGAPVDILRGATRRAFENLVELAIGEKVHFLLLAGDIYDGDWKDYSSGLFFRRLMVRLLENGIPVYLVAGNHDAASVISKKLSLPENVHVFSTRTTESIEVPGTPVVIHGRGFPHRAVPENLAVGYPSAVPDKFNIGLLHTSLTGRVGHDTYAPCSQVDLAQKGYGYWALGHVHQPEVVNRNPWIVFAGNTQGRNAGETGPRGCRLVSVNDALEVEAVDWHALDVVRWRLLQIDLTGVENESETLSRVTHAMSRAVEDAEGRLTAARIVFTGATPLHGFLHRDFHRLRAEIVARSQDQGEQAIWVERIKMATSPVYNLVRLAERDALTRIVLETLEQNRVDPEQFPEDIKAMLDLLPGEVRSTVESHWTEDHGDALLEDIRAIILDALGTTGGKGA